MPSFEKQVFATLSLGAILCCTDCSSPRSEDVGISRKFSSQLPDWVPIYPGSSPSSIFSKQAGVEHYISFELITHDDCTKIVDWYDQKLTAAGYKTYARFDYGNPGCRSTIRSDSADRKRAINLSASSRVDDVTIGIESVDRSGAGANVAIPSWVPMYAGIKLVHVEASGPGLETQHKFSFTSRDDAAIVYPWYESRLTALGFKCTFSVTPNSAGSFTGSSPENGRTFTIHNFPTPPDYTFVVDVLDR
jgi:hypothetical protein